MGISQTTTAIMVFLTGLLPASCHKNSVSQKTAPTAIVLGTTNKAMPTNTVSAKILSGNLGEIALTNHSETCVQLSTGESFILVPKMIDRNSAQITLTLETKNDYGETHDFSVKQVVAKSGKPLEVAMGDLNLTFTPRLVANE